MKRILKPERRQRKLQKRDYSIYRFTKKEWLLYCLAGLSLGTVICWLCYHSIYSAPLALLIMVIYLKIKRKELKEKRKNTLLYHFKEFLESLYTALSSGYSVENGLETSMEDMRRLYGDRDVMVEELRIMTGGLRYRKNVEELFEDFAKRSDLEDIRLFTELLTISKRQGGSMKKVLGDTKRIITEKIDTEREIEKVLASKNYEQKIMSIMPAAVIIYLRLTFEGFIEKLYGNVIGVFIMTICLLLYAGAYFAGRRIVSIRV